MQLYKNIFLFLFLVGNFLSAQISFKAIPDKTKARVGEKIQLSFIITTSQDLDFQQITFPNFSGFQMIGRTVGKNVSYTNGRMTKQLVETVILMPQKKGKYTLNGGVVMVDGKKYVSNPVTLTISEAKKSPKGIDSQMVFMEVILDQNRVYPNENIHAEIKLYAKSFDALRRRTDLEVPGMSDFQVREISKNQARDFEQELINDEVYVSESIAEYQLTPKSTGDLVIPAFKLRVSIPLGMFEEKIIEIRTNHRTVFVDNFPPNAPSNFSGAVGDFRFATFLDKNQVNANESVNYEIELIGDGNLSSIILPKIETPKDLEVYPSKTRNSYKTTSKGEKGKLVDRYVIVPQYGGTYTIPSVEFCYFNPTTKEYKTISSEVVNLKVLGKAKEELNNQLTSNEQDSIDLDSAKSENKLIPELPKQITDIFNSPKEDSSIVNRQTTNFNWWYVGLTLPFIACFIWFFAWRKTDDKEDFAQQTSTTIPKVNKVTTKHKGEYKTVYKEALRELKIAIQQKDKETFLKKSQEVLNIIVNQHANEPKNYSLEESNKILTTKVSEDFATRWESLYYDIQTMSYGVTIDGINLQSSYDTLEDLIKYSLNYKTF